MRSDWSLSRSFREASGGPFRAMGPAATAVGARSLFLDSPRNRGKNRPKAFPLGEPPTPGANCAGSSARLATCLRTARYRLDVRAPTTSWRVPSHGIARRRYRPVCRFAPTLGGADEGATVGGSCRSRPKRGGCCPIAAHEVKRRPRVFVRALDGAGGIATRAGFQRAGPFGCSCILLAGQKYATGGNKKSFTNSNLQFSSLCAAYYTK